MSCKRREMPCSARNASAAIIFSTNQKESDLVIKSSSALLAPCCIPMQPVDSDFRWVASVTNALLARCFDGGYRLPSMYRTDMQDVRIV